MTSGAESESEGDSSQSWPDTEVGSPEEERPPSPALPVRRNFSHYTQVRHNGYLTKRFKQKGASAPWSRQFCTVQGNILRCFAGKVQYGDKDDPVETSIIRGVRPWEAEFSFSSNRGLLIDCEGGDTIIARTDTSAEQEEWMEALGTVINLLGAGTGVGYGSGGVFRVRAGGRLDSDDELDDDDDDDDDSVIGGGSGSSKIQTTYLAQKAALLTHEEATGPCTVVFQVAKTTLRRVDDAEAVGRFNNGDVYLVMHASVATETSSPIDKGGATGGVTRTLFYWVGSKASMDKGTVACIKAVELRRALPGPCSIRREDEGQESPEFLVLFDEVTVAEEESGARVLSKVKRWNELPPIMYSVRVRQSATVVAAAAKNAGQERDGSRNRHAGLLTPTRPLHSSFTVGRIDLDEDQLGGERVLLVDDRNGHVYLWCGQLSTFKHRGFGLEAASALKADNPKGGQVVQVDEDDEPPELRRILDRARKQRLLELQMRAAEGEEEGAEEQGAEQRRLSLMGASAEGAGPAVSLFRVTQVWGREAGYDDGDASLQLSLVACTNQEYISEILGNELEAEQDGNPMLSMLQSDAAFILDVFTEVFVWYGDGAQRAARRGAAKVAHELLRAVSRPRWAEDITHVREAREPFLFRVKFFDWGVAPRRDGVTGRAYEPVNCLTSFHKTVRTIAEVKHAPEEKVEQRMVQTLREGGTKDLPSPADAVVEAVGAGMDMGYGELLMWRVHPRGLVTVPDEEFGHMQSSHSYVLLYGYDAAEGEEALSEDENSDEDSDDSTGLTKTGGDINRRGSYSKVDQKPRLGHNSKTADGNEGSLEEDGEFFASGDDSSSLSGFHKRGFSDDDSDGEESEEEELVGRKTGNAASNSGHNPRANGGRRSTAIGGGGSSSKSRAGAASLSPAAAAGGGEDKSSTSRRKTMFAAVKRESMAGGKTLQHVRRGRQKGRRSSGGGDDDDELETIGRMGVLALEESDEDDSSDVGGDGGNGSRGRPSARGSGGRRERNGSGVSAADAPGRRSPRAGNHDSDEEYETLSAESGGSDVQSRAERRGEVEEESGVEHSDDDDEDDYDDDSGAGAEPRFLIYFWAGARAKKSDWVLWKLELAKTMIPEWQKAIKAEIPQVQVAQGQEPRHFRRIFGQGRDHGRLIVHDRVWRKRDNPERRVSLFKVVRVPYGEFQTFQVPPSVGSLNSMDVFVVICTVVTDDWVGNNDEAVFFWVGRHATLPLQEHGAKVLMALMEYYCMPADFKVHILEEDELYDEHAPLWDELSEMLGGEMSWAHWNDVLDEDFDADEDLDCVPKLYAADAGGGDVALSYAGAVQQSSLTPERVAVLDTVEGVYVWKGSKADAGHGRLVYRACEAYCSEKTLPVGRRVIGVQEGQESLVFRARFDAWDDGGGPGRVTKKFQDLYEKRVAQMSKEGKLGDMMALMGRVLEDEEAVKYWEDRRAAPGGSSAGSFKDDPATRAIQRRGAPGRKPWVKPPPKPPVKEENTKGLEAKRNFLALKERFEGGTGQGFWSSNPVKPTFSRESLLQARQESIRKGHVNKFQATSEAERRAAAVAAAQWGEDREARNPSWGSTSSVRRKKLAATTVLKRTSSVDQSGLTPAPHTGFSTTAPSPINPPGSVPRPARTNRASADSAAGSRASWEASGRRTGSWRKLSAGTGGGLASGARGSLDSAAESGTSEPDQTRIDPSWGVGRLSDREEGEVAAVGGGERDFGLRKPSGVITAGDVMLAAVRMSEDSEEDAALSPEDRSYEAGGDYSDGAEGSGVKKGSRDNIGNGSSGGILRDRPYPSEPGQQSQRGAKPTELRGSRETRLRESRNQVIRERWSGSDADRNGWGKEGSLLEKEAVSPREGGHSRRVPDTEESKIGSGDRGVRAGSGSVVDNEGLLGALEQAEEEERRLSRSGVAPAAAGAAASSLLQSSTARQRPWTNANTSADGVAGEQVHKEKHGRGDPSGAAFSRSGRSRTRSRSGGGGGGDGGSGGDRVSVGDEEVEGADIESERLDRNSAAAAAYRRALARVRHDTVQEGLRQDQARQKAVISGRGGTDGGSGRYPQESNLADVSLAEDGGTPRMLPKVRPPAVSLKHAMSRVKDQHHNPIAGGSGGTPAAREGATRGAWSGLGETGAGVDDRGIDVATISIGRGSLESAASGADEAEDYDSPRNRGRRYDDRWKAPGHAESVLAKFVERLEEHRAQHVPLDEEAAAALAEARANRGAAIAVMRTSPRVASGPGPHMTTRTIPGAIEGGVAATAARSGYGDGGAVNSRNHTVAPALSRASVNMKKRMSGAGEKGRGRETRKRSVGGNPSKREEASSQREHSRSNKISGGGDGGASVGGGIGVGGAWARLGSLAVQHFQRAAEALAGGTKEGTELLDQERTREAATAFLSSSSSRRRPRGEKD